MKQIKLTKNQVALVDDEDFFTKTYRTLNEAKDARDAAIQKFHGEFGSVL